VITAYIQVAMARAVYEYVIDDNGIASVFGSIPDLPGVWSDEPTYPDCQQALQSTLEDWLLLGLRLGHHLPAIAGIDLNVSQLEVA
jgi:predicted RNase H-like HicB family nuclease